MRTRRLVDGLITVLVVLSPLSCGKGNSGKLVYPVQGQVFFQGKPAQGALVLFHLLDDLDAQGARPHGRVEQDGTFRLTTYQLNDGAPAGEYVVTVDWRQTIPGRSGGMPSFLPAKYGIPKQSPLRATVKAENNSLPPFQLGR